MVSRCTLWVRTKRRLALSLLGDKCSNPNCHNVIKYPIRLECCHVKKTPLSGQAGNRGSYNRISDVLRYPLRYILLCTECHDLYDNGVLKLNTKAIIEENKKRIVQRELIVHLKSHAR